METVKISVREAGMITDNLHKKMLLSVLCRSGMNIIRRRKRDGLDYGNEQRFVI